MALTTNYSWDKPTVGGDVGAWGTKLNTLFDGVDTQVKNRQTEAAAALAAAGVADAKAVVADGKAVVAEAETLAMANRFRKGAEAVVHGGCFASGAVNTLFPSSSGTLGFLASGASGAAAFAAVWHLPELVIGMRITAFQTRTLISGGGDWTITYSLTRRDDTTQGNVSVLASHVISTAGSDQTGTSSGLSIDVAAGKVYSIEVSAVRNSGATSITIYHSKLTVTRP